MYRQAFHVASVLTAAVFAFGAQPASAQLVAYDGFGNGPLANLHGSTGGAGWTSAWADAGTDPTLIAGPGLGYPGLATAPGAAVTPTAGGIWPSSIYQRVFQAPPPGTNALYVSFLMRDDAAYGIWGGVSFGQYPSKMTVGSPMGYYAFGLMMSEGLGDVSNKPLVQGETTLVVVKISKNSPAPGNTYRMYLDPTIGSAEPSFPDATFAIGQASLPTYISIDNGTGFTTDEIRIGTSWSSVLPAQISTWTDLGFAKPGASGAPHLAGSGPLSAHSVASITLTNAKPASLATLIIGSNLLNAPFLGGVLVPEPTIVVPLVTSAAGAISLEATWPNGIPAGLPLRFQYWIQDPAATFGLSASNGLQGISQ
jgi:hypothetical protein